MIGIDRSYVDINILKYFEMCSMQIYVKGFCTDKPMFASLSLSRNSYPYIILRHMYLYCVHICTISWTYSVDFQKKLPGRWPGSWEDDLTAKPCAQLHWTKLINKKLQKSIPTHAWRFLSGTLEVRGLVPSRKWGVESVHGFFINELGGPIYLDSKEKL